MAISLFLLLMLLIIVAVTYYHFTQGFFSATISAILCAFAAVLALGWHEAAVVSILGGQMADQANAIMVMSLFCLIYLGLRTLFDKVVPGNVTFPSKVSKAGAAVMGLVAGTFAAGVCGFAAQALPMGATVLGYARYDVSDREGRPPKEVAKKDEPATAFDYLTDPKPFHERAPDTVQKLLVPVDDFVVNAAVRLSGSGALATSTPIAATHPDWLNELFGQRLGIEAGGKRVMLNNPKQQDLVAKADAAAGKGDAGVYDFGTERVRRHNADFDALHPSKADWFPPQTEDGQTAVNPKQIIVVIRMYFGAKAKDPRFSAIQLSPASVRLVTQRPNPDRGGAMEWTNYYPIGTLEGLEQPTTRPSSPKGPPPEQFVFYYQRQDDYIVIDDSTVKEGTATGDKGVDFVFQVDRAGFLEGGNKVSEGTFVEAKRLARVDLSGEVIKPRAALKPNPSSVYVTRKKFIKENEPHDPTPLVQKLVAGGATWKGNSDSNAYLKFGPVGAGGTGSVTVTHLETGASRGGATYRPLVALGKKLVVDMPTLRLKDDQSLPPLKRTVIEWDEEGLMTLTDEAGNPYVFTPPEKGARGDPPPPTPGGDGGGGTPAATPGGTADPIAELPPVTVEPTEAPVIMADLTKRLAGTWEGTVVSAGNPINGAAVTYVFQSNGAMSLVMVVPGVATEARGNGTWKAVNVHGDAAMVIDTVLNIRSVPPGPIPPRTVSTKAAITFNGTDQLTLKQSTETYPLTRKAGAAPAATPGTPTTPTPPPAPAVAFAVGEQDQPKNANFPATIGFPSGSTGEVDLGPVGKVTLVEEDDGTGGKRLALSALTVNATTLDKLDAGTGGSAKRLAVPAGHEVIQIAVTPAAGGTGWEWAKAVGNVTAVDAAGKPHDVRGAFATLPGDAVWAKYGSEQKLSLDDHAPSPARPAKVDLVFVVPTGTTFKEIRDGAKVVKAFNPPIPAP